MATAGIDPHRRITVAVAVVLLGVAAGLVRMTVEHLDQRELRRAGDGLRTAAHSAADEIAILLHDSVREISALSRRLSRDDVSPITPELGAVRAESAFLFWLAATDGDGLIVAATDRASIGRDRGDSAWFRRATAAEGSILLDMGPAADAGGEWASAVAATIPSRSEGPLGVVAGLVGTGPIEATVARRADDLGAQLPGEESVGWLVVRQDGVVLGDSTGGLRGTDVRAGGILPAGLDADLAGWFTEERGPGSGAAVVTGYAHVSGVTSGEDLHWRVLLQRHRSAVLAPLHRTLRIAGVGFAAVVLPASAALFRSRRARRRAESER